MVSAEEKSLQAIRNKQSVNLFEDKLQLNEEKIIAKNLNNVAAGQKIKILYDNESKVGDFFADKANSTIAYLFKQAKVIKDSKVFAADYADVAQEIKEKRNKAMKKLHDRDVATLVSQLSTERGLDVLEKMMTSYRKKTERVEKLGKMTHAETENLQALQVHNMLVMFTLLKGTHDIDKARKYLEFYNPIGKSTKSTNNFYDGQLLNDVASVLEADGVEISRQYEELVS